MDESRKAFEQWFPEMVEGMPPGMVEVFDKMLFMAWQASRAAIEIELPPTVDGSNVPFAGNAWNAYRVEAVKAIRAAGIKVKE
ncbi:hypothetical protein L8S32_05200 [Enterobacter asburiae]|uniref:hypothetical protein n=1 Tax=Enterobacter asburiae TaxID=61645 RepID=UPI002002DEC2|nr:hypothetical protein [Enterobacter asburiae]MCK6836255.1 hypothetical protein [Enterobacter asburiae]